MEKTLIANTTDDYKETHLLSNDEIYANFDPLLSRDIISLLNEPQTFSADSLLELSGKSPAYSADLDEHELALSS